MSEFVQTMKDWRRMCSAMRSCDDCPMNEVKCWAKGPDDLIDSFERRESVITAWAEEHPEQVYPTWAEWLVDQGILEIANVEGTETMYDTVLPKPSLFDPIPDNIAEKLEIEPKWHGGCNQDY